METSTGLFFSFVGNAEGIPVYIFHTSPFDQTYMKRGLSLSNSEFGFYFFDLPNHGKSRDLNFKDMSFLKISKLVEEFRKEKGHSEVHVLGHGIGGFIAQTYATRFKKHTLTLTVSNSASNSRYRTEMAWNIRDQLSKSTIQKIADYQGSTDHDSLQFRFQNSLHAYFMKDHQSKASELMASLIRFPSEAYIGIANFMIPKYDVREGLQSFGEPVLVISSKFDVWPSSTLEFYHTDIPHAKFIEIESGHFPMIEKPDTYWELVIDFLRNSR